MNKFIKNFAKYRYLVKELVRKDIKLKYRRSYLGIVWTLLEPLLSMIVLTIVFSNFKGSEDVSFPVYILTGRLVVSFFSTSTKQATKSIRQNASMIKKVYVPKYIYPLSSTISNFIIFLLSLVILVLVSIVLKVQPTIYVLTAVIPLFLLFVLALGVGMIVATLSVFFRDMEYLWGVVMMLITYCSAVFYSPEKVIENGYGWIFDWNPVYSVILNFRNAVLYGRPPEMHSLIFLTIVSFVSLIIGFTFFYKKQDEFILHV